MYWFSRMYRYHRVLNGRIIKESRTTIRSNVNICHLDYVHNDTHV